MASVQGAGRKFWELWGAGFTIEATKLYLRVFESDVKLLFVCLRVQHGGLLGEVGGYISLTVKAIRGTNLSQPLSMQRDNTYEINHDLQGRPPQQFLHILIQECVTSPPAVMKKMDVLLPSVLFFFIDAPKKRAIKWYVSEVSPFSLPGSVDQRNKTLKIRLGKESGLK